jgi:hypothetical protein
MPIRVSLATSQVTAPPASVLASFCRPPHATDAAATSAPAATTASVLLMSVAFPFSG